MDQAIPVGVEDWSNASFERRQISALGLNREIPSAVNNAGVDRKDKEQVDHAVGSEKSDEILDRWIRETMPN